jgi:PTS system N-acetylgalactosamine-specific IIA component
MPDTAALPQARRAIVAGHGDFADGVISAVQQISGRGDAFRGVTNTGLSAVALEEMLRAVVRAHRAKVIFTDLPAGSCTIAARRIARDDAGIVVVSGANLSVLLAWALGSDDSVAGCEHAVERGRGAMTVIPGGPASEVGSAH